MTGRPIVRALTFVTLTALAACADTHRAERPAPKSAAASAPPAQPVAPVEAAAPAAVAEFNMALVGLQLTEEEVAAIVFGRTHVRTDAGGIGAPIVIDMDGMANNGDVYRVSRGQMCVKSLTEVCYDIFRYADQYAILTTDGYRIRLKFISFF